MDNMTAVAELAQNAARPFDQARAMPVSAYTSEVFLQLENARIFEKSWICAGRSDALKVPGDYMTLSISGEPLIVLRDGQRQLRALSNVCRHRMSMLLEGCGNVRAITCPYHAWTYSLEGTLRGAPAMDRNKGFCKEDNDLAAVRCIDWQGWIMLTLSPDLTDPSHIFAGVDTLVGYLDMTNYVETFREEHRWNTNWKILAENFMESYHLPMCHSGTIGSATKLRDMVCPEGFEGFNYHHILKDDSVPLALAHPTNTTLVGDERRRTWLLALYPSLMITLTPGYFWYLSLMPDGPDHVKTSTVAAFHPNSWPIPMLRPT